MQDNENEQEDKLRRVNQQRKSVEEPAKELRYQDASRKRLARILKKKMTTAFIGALARFEQFFGEEIWGHGKPEEECTPEQLAWREVWEECRTEVLNNGNHQWRAVENEVVQYVVAWNRYQTTLPVKEQQEPKEE